MKSRQSKGMFFTLLFSVLFSSTAFAQSSLEHRIHNFGDKAPPEGPGMMRGPMATPMEDWFRRLNLTEEQSAKLRESRESYLKDTLAWRNELVVKRFDLRDMLFRNKQPDPNQILAKQREISDLEAKIEERAVLHQIEVRKILTPEQLQLLPPYFGHGGFRGPGPHMRGRFRGMGQP